MQIFGLVLTIAFFQGNGLAPIRQNVAENAVVNCTLQNKTTLTTVLNPTKCITLYVLNYWWKVDLQKEFILHSVTVKAHYFNFQVFIQPAHSTGNESMTSCTHFNDQQKSHVKTYDCEGFRARYITLVGRQWMSVCTVKASSLPLSNSEYNMVYGKASQSSTLEREHRSRRSFQKEH
uniref:Uncharacterized protein n=1 Tax=Eptatretus burgeri TaxID=7764 RepID=A0A8C4QTP9_EPTBU